MVSEAAFFVLGRFQVPARLARSSQCIHPTGIAGVLVEHCYFAEDPVMVQIPQLDLSSTSSGQAAQSRGFRTGRRPDLEWEAGNTESTTWRSLSGRLHRQQQAWSSRAGFPTNRRAYAHVCARMSSHVLRVCSCACMRRVLPRRALHGAHCTSAGGT